MTSAEERPPVIHLVEDDIRVSKALERLLRTAGHRCAAYGSAEAFLSSHDPEMPGCAILDLRLPGMDGFELQARLAEAASHLPLVFLTGEGDIPGAVRAMQAGAVNFLTKPVEPEALLDAVARSLEQDAAGRAERALSAGADSRLARLTPREREVLDLVVAGRLNKQIAAELGVAEKTVKVHRGRLMKKTGVRSVPDLVRLLARASGTGP